MIKTLIPITSLLLLNVIYVGLIFSITYSVSSDQMMTTQNLMQHNFQRFFGSILIGPWAHDYSQIIMDNPYESLINGARTLHGLLSVAILYVLFRMTSMKAAFVTYFMGNIFFMMTSILATILYLQIIIQGFTV